jgi:hypothetical protein
MVSTKLVSQHFQAMAVLVYFQILGLFLLIYLIFSLKYTKRFVAKAIYFVM